MKIKTIKGDLSLLDRFDNEVSMFSKEHKGKFTQTILSGERVIAVIFYEE